MDGVFRSLAEGEAAGAAAGSLAADTKAAEGAIAAEAGAVAAAVEHYVAEHLGTASAALTTVSSVLVAVAIPILLASHWRRIRYIWEFLPASPEVHRLLPNAHRNTQLAWLCNF